MAGTRAMHVGRQLIQATVLLSGIALHGEFGQDMVNTSPIVITKQIAQLKSYIPDTKFEPISFYSRHHEGSPEKILRRGVLKLKQNAPATVLICHGYMCDKNDINFLRAVFPQYNVMTFDFRAHGEHTSDQVCTFGKEEAFDVIGAVKYLRSRPETKDTPIIAYGFSMGAASAIEAQSLVGNLFSAMILDCPFDSSENLLKRGLSHLSIRLFGYEIPLPGRGILQKYAYTPIVQSFVKVVLKTVAKMDALQVNTKIMPVEPVTSIEKVNVPCFFITCKNDEKVSVDAVVSVYAAAKGYKRLWITNGRRHFDSYFYNPEKYSYKVNNFIQKALTSHLNMNKVTKITQDPTT